MELLDPDSAYVSSGELPPYARVAELVATARDRFSGIDQGEVSTVYPALARMPSALFGVCVLDTQGRIHAAGDAEHPFTIMSVSKPFVFALICERIGATSARARLGVNATGRSFNSLAVIEAAPEGRTNPMVNAGAIATSSLAPGVDTEAKWRFLQEGLSRFAGRELSLNDEVFASAAQTNTRNRSIAWMLENVGAIFCDPLEAVDLYTRQCALDVTAKDLAVMGPPWPMAASIPSRASRSSTPMSATTLWPSC